jgi:outer membrane protein insertion porin family
VFLYDPSPSNTDNPLLTDSLRHTQIYAFKAQMAHDTRDNTFLPTEGHFVSLDVAYTMGTFQYPTYSVDFRKFFMLRQRPDGSGRHVLSLYNQFGITGPDTPIYERFYAGGFSTLRGFQFRGASPQEPAVTANPNGALIQVGGDFQNLSSVEYMFPITADDMLRMVAFCDFGTVEQSVTINWNQFRVAPGIGFRISLPALGPAPIALDFAVPVAYADDDLKQVFSFFVGYSR